MADDYATLEELKSTLELSGETFADADLTLALTAASRGVDNITNRRFFVDADAAQVRHFSPVSARFLLIDDLVELTSLEVDSTGDGTFDDTWADNTDFVLEPLNAPADGEPWRRLRVHPQSTRRLSKGVPRSVKLTGKFGWPAVPEPIKEATIVLASKLLRRAREAPFGVVTFGIEGGAAIRVATQDPDVKFLTKDYVRDEILIF